MDTPFSRIPKLADAVDPRFPVDKKALLDDRTASIREQFFKQRVLSSLAYLESGRVAARVTTAEDPEKFDPGQPSLFEEGLPKVTYSNPPSENPDRIVVAMDPGNRDMTIMVAAKIDLAGKIQILEDEIRDRTPHIMPGTATVVARIERDRALAQLGEANRLHDLTIARLEGWAGLVMQFQTMLMAGPVFAAARDHALHGASDLWGPIIPHPVAQMVQEPAARPAYGITKVRPYGS